METSFFILDAIFSVGLRRSAAEEAQGSNEAAEILKRVAACVNAAVASKGVQSQPHVVLLDKAWYKAELTPLLAEWAELWLRAHGAARASPSITCARTSPGPRARRRRRR